MTRNPTALVPLLALVATGCSPALADLVLFNINDGAGVSIDTICNSPCAGDDVSADIAFAEHILVDPTAELTLEQYRVEYAISGSDAALDYHSDTLAVSVTSGTTSYFTVNLAAASQRDALDALYLDGLDTATATITFAGYDQHDQVLQLDVDVPLTFGRLDQSAGTSSSTDTGVTQ